ncbi:MAG TPA: transketolase C-terminal domain-containing protein [Candidatus Eisenbacteria bacterium]
MGVVDTKPATGGKWEMLLTRQAYADALVELGEEDPRVVVLDADLAQSTLTRFFGEKYPHRFFEMGISEQDMVGTAVGLSHMGFIPFLSSYSIFLSGRAWDQVRNGVAYPSANVKIAAAHGGISVGKDGPTHQSMEDVGVIRPIVNFTVIVPCDYHETFKTTKWSAHHEGPVFFRMGREKVPVITTKDTPFEPGKAIVMEDGPDGTIIACGLMVAQALEAAEILKKKGIRPRVLNMHTIKPLDHGAVLAAARETGAIVTAEEHSRYGGLGSAVAEVIVESDYRVPMRIIGVNDRYLESGPPEDLMQLAGLTPQKLAEALEGALKKGR